MTAEREGGHQQGDEPQRSVVVKKADRQDNNGSVSRRNFLEVGGAAIAGSALAATPAAGFTGAGGTIQVDGIKAWRTLGKTGFKVSDLAVGGVPLRDSAVVRHAYDHGMNYFDVAESYSRGGAELAVGEAMPHMDRSKIFITSKIAVGGGDTEETIRDRFTACLGRMRTDYIDAFYMHNPGSIEVVNTPAFHAATDQLKADGKLKHIGISSHGAGRGSPDTHEEIMMAAATDGRFDVMLFTYSFLNREAGDRVLAACRENGVGTTAMKVIAGDLKPTPIDPDNLTEAQQASVERTVSRGRTREQAIANLQRQVESQEESWQQTKPFMERWGISTRDQLDLASVQWVLQNEDMHTVCIAANSIENLNKYLPLSGTAMGDLDLAMLADYGRIMSSRYCRPGCDACMEACPAGLQVSTVMRYAYYFERQGRERDAMVLYRELDGNDASHCLGCDAPCSGACPYGLDVQANMLEAHARLSL
jgi:aryl-alcohol dehydrogenase-like predicted oxidoreductase